MTGTAVPDASFDVVIVGLGPVGATLANLLGICGVSTVVLDREAEVLPLPRAVHFDDEIMRVFQTIGVADAVEKSVRVNPGMRFVDAAGNLLLDWPRPQELGPQGWHASYRFHQPDLERVLRKGLNRFDHVQVRTRAEVSEVEEREGGAVVRYEDLSCGRAVAVRGKYAVGCDGARSTLRRIIGSQTKDFGFRERWLVVDALLKHPKPELGDHTIQYCNPARPATYVRGPGNRRRWEITVLDHEESEAISAPAAVWALLAPWLSPDEADLERTAVYTFHSTVAMQWRKGRLLLAGDAAHQTPPFMGQGMCAGIRDAANLAWKLSHSLRGGEEDVLLDSYQAERQPHAEAYIETAVRLGELINTCGTREALATAFRQPDGSVRMESIAPRLGRSLYVGSQQLAGTVFPQPTLRDGRRFDDHTGYRPAMLVEAGLWSAVPMAEKHLTADAGTVVLTSDMEPFVSVCLSTHGVRAIAIRPDRYVCGTASDIEGLAALLDKFR